MLNFWQGPAAVEMAVSRTDLSATVDAPDNGAYTHAFSTNVIPSAA